MPNTELNYDVDQPTWQANTTMVQGSLMVWGTISVVLSISGALLLNYTSLGGTIYAVIVTALVALVVAFYAVCIASRCRNYSQDLASKQSSQPLKEKMKGLAIFGVIAEGVIELAVILLNLTLPAGAIWIRVACAAIAFALLLVAERFGMSAAKRIIDIEIRDAAIHANLDTDIDRILRQSHRQ